MTSGNADLSTEDILKHSGWLHSLAVSLVRDETDAEDLVQDTWLRTLERPPRDSKCLARWLKVVLRNLTLKRFRDDTRRQRREFEWSTSTAGDSSPEKSLARAEMQRNLAEAIVRLKEPYLTTVVLRYFDGLRAADIAQRHGVDVTTVRWRLRKALGDLRVALDEHHGGRQAWMSVFAPIVPSATAASPAAESAASGTFSAPWKIFGVGTCTVAVLLAGWVVFQAAPQNQSPEGPTDPPTPTTVQLPTKERPDLPLLQAGKQIAEIGEVSVIVHLLVTQNDRLIVADSYKVNLPKDRGKTVHKSYKTAGSVLSYSLRVSGARIERRGRDVALDVGGIVKWSVSGGPGFGGASGSDTLSSISGTSLGVGGFKYRCFKLVTPVQKDDPLARGSTAELVAMYRQAVGARRGLQGSVWEDLLAEYQQTQPTPTRVPGRNPVRVAPKPEAIPSVVLYDKAALSVVPESKHIRSLVVRDSTFGDRDLAALSNRNAIVSLDLSTSAVKGSGLTHLSDFIALDRLVLPAALSGEAINQHLSVELQRKTAPGGVARLEQSRSLDFLDIALAPERSLLKGLGRLRLVEVHPRESGSKSRGGFFPKRQEYREAKLVVYGELATRNVSMRLERSGGEREWSVAKFEVYE